MKEETKRNISKSKKGISMKHSKQFKKGQIPWNKNKKCSQLSGKNHWNWKGGRRLSDGYFLIKSPNHPNCKVDGYVYEHRLVMEKMIGRYLKPNEIVHHKNENGLDNREKNLKLYQSKGKHISKEHSIRDKLGRFSSPTNILNIYICLNNTNKGGK